jgi:hypothetical protein
MEAAAPRTSRVFGMASLYVGIAAVAVLALVVVLGRPLVQPGEGGGVPGAGAEVVSPTASPDAVASPSPNGTAGLVVLGHAGLLGTDADPTKQRGLPQPEHSWASGTGPEVDSIYERIVRIRPEDEGLVSNQAGYSFAQSSSLEGQAIGALREVPHPALVLIQTIDNDVRCDGSDQEHVRQFGKAVGKALDRIVAASPESQVLMVGARAIQPWVDFLRDHPDLQASVEQGHGFTSPNIGTGMCDVFDPDGRVVPEHVATLSAIYATYEEEQARVCALYPQCHDDGDVDDEYVYAVEDWSDWQYRSVAGNAEMAERYWPLVAHILELPAPSPTEGAASD